MGAFPWGRLTHLKKMNFFRDKPLGIAPNTLMTNLSHRPLPPGSQDRGKRLSSLSSLSSHIFPKPGRAATPGQSSAEGDSRANSAPNRARLRRLLKNSVLYLSGHTIEWM